LPSETAKPGDNTIDSKTLLRTIAEAASAKKAEHIVLMDVRGLTSFTDFLVLATGTSDRQVRAIGESIEDAVAKAKGPRLVGREGYAQGEWVLVDYGEIVVHLFSDDVRHVYDMENLWAAAPRLQWNDKNPPTELFAAPAQQQVAVAASSGSRRRSR